METRRFGRGGHRRAIPIFGGAAFWEISPSDADQAIETVLEVGTNHICIACAYLLMKRK